ncbi:MAG: hypothetical protein ACRCSI_02690 [Eubacterium aggregans]
MSNLELNSSESLLRELGTRYETLIVLGVDHEGLKTTVLDGPAYAVAGLLHEATIEIMGTIQKYLEEKGSDSSPNP